MLQPPCCCCCCSGAKLQEITEQVVGTTALSVSVGGQSQEAKLTFVLQGHAHCKTMIRRGADGVCAAGASLKTFRCFHELKLDTRVRLYSVLITVD